MLRTRGSGDGRESGELKLERSLHRIAALSYFTDPRFLVWLLGFNANDVISSRLVTQDRLGRRAFPRDQDGLVERLSDLAHESAHGIELPLPPSRRAQERRARDLSSAIHAAARRPSQIGVSKT